MGGSRVGKTLIQYTDTCILRQVGSAVAALRVQQRLPKGKVLIRTMHTVENCGVENEVHQKAILSTCSSSPTRRLLHLFLLCGVIHDRPAISSDIVVKEENQDDLQNLVMTNTVPPPFCEISSHTPSIKALVISGRDVSQKCVKSDTFHRHTH